MALFLTPAPGRDGPTNRTLAFTFPAIAFVSWVDSMGPVFGLSSVNGIALWFFGGTVLAGVKISAFLSSTRDRENALHKELADHYREIVENSTDLVAEVDSRGIIVYANPAHRTVLGVEPDDVIGLPGSAIEISPSAGELATSVGIPAPGEDLLFVARHRDDGRPVTLECRFHSVRHASGERRTVVTSRDVTARAAEERHREALNARLEALVESRTADLTESLRQLQEAHRLASLGTMAAGVAHQINNPVGSIQMGAEFALATPDDDPDQRQAWRRALENAVEQAQRCGRIVSSMLQFARNEPTKRSDVDLVEILRRCCEGTEAYASVRNATVTAHGLDAPLPIHGSAIELEQALLNVLRNACEASDEPHRVVVSLKRSSERATLTIHDDGKGIPQDALDQVLDPFFTTRLDAGGTGLGLSVAHGVIVDHGGHLSIESAPGVGTTVTITLPVRPDPSSSRRLSRDPTPVRRGSNESA
ncbi:MAG: ATP-binding protein [Myxococcota bacterium]